MTCGKPIMYEVEVSEVVRDKERYRSLLHRTSPLVPHGTEACALLVPRAIEATDPLEADVGLG